MAKAITIRTDEGTLDQLGELARSTERSRNFLANQASNQYAVLGFELGLAREWARIQAECFAARTAISVQETDG